MHDKQFAAIKERIANAPEGCWYAALGSGNHAMTAVYCEPRETPEDGVPPEPQLIADVLPAYAVGDPRAWENRVPLLEFISHSLSDMKELVETIEEYEQIFREVHDLAAKGEATPMEIAFHIGRETQRRGRHL
jgi:hypothetical protein